MSESCLFSLILMAVVLLLCQLRKSCAIVLSLALIYSLLIGTGLAPQFLLKNLQTYNLNPSIDWKSNNVIVLLGFGTVKAQSGEVAPLALAYARIYKAAELYYACQQTNHRCSIIITGGDPLHTGLSEAEVYRQALLKLRIKDSAIITENNSLNTYQNAEFTQAILMSHHYNKVVLTSSGFHLKRSILYFRHFGIEAQPVAADFLRPFTSALPISYNFMLTDLALHEYLGIARYKIYNWLGLNAKYKSPHQA